MPLLTAVVIVLAALTILNITISAAVIRLLREPDRLLRGTEYPLPPVGSKVDKFSATSIGGGTITDATVAVGEYLVAFLSVTCPPCQRLTDRLADLALPT